MRVDDERAKIWETHLHTQYDYRGVYQLVRLAEDLLADRADLLAANRAMARGILAADDPAQSEDTCPACGHSPSTGHHATKPEPCPWPAAVAAAHGVDPPPDPRDAEVERLRGWLEHIHQRALTGADDWDDRWVMEQVRRALRGEAVPHATE